MQDEIPGNLANASNTIAWWQSRQAEVQARLNSRRAVVFQVRPSGLLRELFPAALGWVTASHHVQEHLTPQAVLAAHVLPCHGCAVVHPELALPGWCALVACKVCCKAGQTLQAPNLASRRAAPPPMQASKVPGENGNGNGNGKASDVAGGNGKVDSDDGKKPASKGIKLFDFVGARRS